MGRTFFIIAALLALSGSALAETPSPGPGRYQMLTIQVGASTIGGRVLILDTQDGDLWKWFEYSGYPVSAETGSAIMYLGKLKPGTKAGEIIQRLVNPKAEEKLPPQKR